MIEMIAGRLAADLEREMLLAEAGRQKREATSAGDLPSVLAAPIDVAKAEAAKIEAPIIRVKPQGLPSTPPVIDGWQVAAGVSPTDTASGAFFDWFERGDGSLAIVAGCVSGLDMQAALAAAELRAAGRVLGPDGRPANQFIERAGELLWAHSCGDLSAGLMQAYIWPNQPTFESAVGGPLQAFRILQDDYELIAKPTVPLGSSEGSSILLHKHRSPHHDLIVSYALSETHPKIGNWAAEVNGSLAKALAPMRKSSAERLLETAQEILSQACTKDRGRDRVVLVIKRR
jgi:serine phosphatase RsbU (regulator of sigma subunit)